MNCYLRSIRSFWSWLISEEIIKVNPFTKIKIPKPPKKVIATFSDSQLQTLLSAIDTCTSEGYRNRVIILTLLDTGLRVSELVQIKLGDAWLQGGILKVMGKGKRERLIPIGSRVQRLLWRYVNRHRPKPANENREFLFLTMQISC